MSFDLIDRRSKGLMASIKSRYSKVFVHHAEHTHTPKSRSFSFGARNR